MLLLHVEQLQKHFGAEAPVLESVTFDVFSGRRIALVGPNGTGKTTLLRIIAGHEEPDVGSVDVHSAVRIGYLEQSPQFVEERTLYEDATTALADLIQLQHEAEAIAARLAEKSGTEEQQRLATRYDALQEELVRRDGFQLDHKIRRVLTGLGIDESMYDAPVATLSGGERNRLCLAKLLLAEPDLMLLDEPSNHLDVDATEWLEEYLAATSSAMILVSHDRYFLDKVTTHTLELFHGTVDLYTGNFSAYTKQKDDRLLVERRTYEKQQEEIEKTKEFIRRHHYGQKHAQAEDRRKKLERLEADQVAPPREISLPPMRFTEGPRGGEIVFRVEHLSKAFDRPLFSDLSFDVQRGECWAILGPNGTGKTTLLRCLMGSVPPDQGAVHRGHGIEIAYFDQHLRTLAMDAPVVEAVRPDGMLMDEKERRNLLARFGIVGEAAFQPVGSLSGGEKCRVALARLSATEANLLILDEPTNHLDLWAREALERAIDAFSGTVIMVSHDRYFVNRTADHLLVVEPHRFRVIDGNYDTYRHLVHRGLAQECRTSNSKERAGGNSASPKSASKAKASDGAATSKRKRRFPFRKIEDLEAEIFQRETLVEELTMKLAEPDILRDGERVRQVHRDLDAENDKLAQLYEHWEEATELNW